MFEIVFLLYQWDEYM